VRRLFHRKPLNGTGLNGYIAQITGPVRVESDGSVVCLAVTLDFGYSE
jgi:hypothetical protein